MEDTQTSPQKGTKTTKEPPWDKEEIVTLNVGGMLYTTRKDTLLKGDTMLSKMFSGQYQVWCKHASCDGNP